jgi:hypothetical protein
VQTSFWPARTVPILLLPAGEQGQRVLELARSWVRLGLLGPALWVSPEDVTIDKGAPPLVIARVLRLGDDRDLIELRRDLFEILARDELSRVRVLKIRSATPKRELDELQDSISVELSRYVKHSVPSVDPNQNISEQQLVLSEATLICAPTEFQVTQRVAWSTDDPGLIVVASPEDRSSPWSGDAFVRDNDRFVGFCLMHIATVSGLWNAAPVGTFDLFAQEASMHHSIWVSRVFVNAVMMDGFAGRIAAGVLADASNGNLDVVDASTSTPPSGTAFIPEERRAHYSQRVVDGIFRLDHGQLDYLPAPEFSTREKRRLSFGAQLVSFTEFTLDKLVTIPSFAFRWFKRRASQSATRAFHSDDGLAVVGDDSVQFDRRDRALASQRDRVAAEVLVARSAAAEFEDQSSVRSTPALWARLREVVFGALDGSADLTDLGFAPIEGKVPIFARAGDLIQPIDDRWEFPLAERPDDIPASVGIEVLETIESLRRSIVEWAREAETKIVERETERREVTEDLESLENRYNVLVLVLFEHELVEFDDDGVAVIIKGKRAPSQKQSSVEEQENESINLVGLKREFIDAPNRMKLGRRRLEAANAMLDEALSEKRSRDSVVADLEKWIEGHDRSVYGQIVAGMSARRTHAAEQLSATEASLESVTPPEPGQLISLQKKFHLTISIGAAIVVALLLLFFVIDSQMSVVSGPAFWPSAWQAVAITAGIVLIVVLLASTAYHLGWSRLERQIIDSGDRLEWASNSIRHNRRELRRMEALHRQALEWLQLLAGAVHKPWIVKDSWLSNEPPAVDLKSMPFAVRLAVTREDDPVAAGRMKREAAQALLVKGWRARAFARLLDELCTKLGYDAATLGLEALDADLPHASNHSRRILAQHAADPETLVTIAHAYLQEIVAEVQGVSLSQSNPRVTLIVADPLRGDDENQPVDSALREPPLEWDQFLLDSVVGRSNPVTPIGSLGIAEMALADAHHENVRSFLLVPDRLTSDAHIAGVDGRLEVTGYSDSDVRSLDLVIRVDVAGPIPASAARLWEKANSAPRNSTTRVSKPREGL